MVGNGANAVVCSADGPGDRRGGVDVTAGSNCPFHRCAIVVGMFEEGVQRSQNGGLDLYGNAKSLRVWLLSAGGDDGFQRGGLVEREPIAQRKDVRREFGALFGNGLAR